MAESARPSSESSSMHNASPTPGPPTCPIYSSIAGLAAGFATNHLRSDGDSRAICQSTSGSVSGLQAMSGVNSSGGRGGSTRALGLGSGRYSGGLRCRLLRRRMLMGSARNPMKQGACLRRIPDMPTLLQRLQTVVGPETIFLHEHADHFMHDVFRLVGGDQRQIAGGAYRRGRAYRTDLNDMVRGVPCD